jgi:hypothetical protein
VVSLLLSFPPFVLLGVTTSKNTTMGGDTKSNMVSQHNYSPRTTRSLAKTISMYEHGLRTQKNEQVSAPTTFWCCIHEVLGSSLNRYTISSHLSWFAPVYQRQITSTSFPIHSLIVLQIDDIVRHSAGVVK